MVDLELCSVEKDEDKWFSLKFGKKFINLKYSTKEEKEQWLDHIQKITRNDEFLNFSLIFCLERKR